MLISYINATSNTSAIVFQLSFSKELFNFIVARFLTPGFCSIFSRTASSRNANRQLSSMLHLFTVRQTSAVVFQLSCSVQPAVLSCSFTTPRNCLRSCILSSMISLISNGSCCKRFMNSASVHITKRFGKNAGWTENNSSADR